MWDEWLADQSETTMSMIIIYFVRRSWRAIQKSGFLQFAFFILFKHRIYGIRQEHIDILYEVATERRPKVSLSDSWCHVQVNYFLLFKGKSSVF